MSAQSDQRPTDRYGTSKTLEGRVAKLSKKQRIGIIVTIIAVLVIGSVWFTFNGYLKPYTYKEVGYQIVSPTEAKVEFQISKRPEDTVQCAIHVLNDVYAVVGMKVVTIGPDTAKDTADSPQSNVTGAKEVGRSTSSDRFYVMELRTDSEGVTGIVDSCWVVPEN